MPTGKSERERRPRWPVIGIGTVLLLLVAYVLSSGPLLVWEDGPLQVALASNDVATAERWSDFYQPVLWAYGDTPLYEPLKWYFGFFQPERRPGMLIYVDEALIHVPEILERMREMESEDTDATPYRTDGGVF